LFDLNTYMEVKSEEDFQQLRQQFQIWRKRHSMFVHDVSRIEHIVEGHIQKYSIALVYYRQTKKKNYLESAQKEIDEINRLIQTVEKIELMSILSRG
jgi:predicted  nucleic acid-binding Zn-ribbon protein